MKNDPSSRLFVVGCWEWQMHPTGVWEVIIFYKIPNSKMPLAILLTVQTCPVMRDKAESSWYVCCQEGPIQPNTCFGVIFLQMAKMPTKTVITVKNCQ